VRRGDARVESAPPDAFPKATRLVDERIREELRQETNPFLVRRLRAALWIIAFATALFAATDAWLRPAQSRLVSVIYGTELVLAFGLIGSLRSSRAERWAIPIGLILTAEVALAVAALGLVTNDAFTGLLIAMIMIMTTAALFPWGPVPQLLAVAIVLSPILGSAFRTSPSLAATYPYGLVSIVVCSVASVSIACEFHRYRLERKHAEAGLRDSQLLFRQFTDTVADVFWLSDADMTVFHYVSPAYERLLGRPAHGLYLEARSFLECIHSEDRQTVAGVLPQVSVGQPVEMEFRVVRADGAVRWLWARTFPIGDPAAGVKRVAGLASDITERKRIEQKLADARDAALEASRLKTAFLANVSHELRTPLNVILGFARLLAEDALAAGLAEAESHVGAMSRASKRLIRTIDGILDLSKIESGTFAVKRKPLHMKTIVERLLDNVRPLAELKNLVLDSRIEEARVHILFDEYCLSEALAHLVDNAIKFTERGQVTVRLGREPAGRLFLEITDTGIGIGPDYFDELFTPFSQEDLAATRQYEGSGLGLALAKRYLELNQARISVASEKHKGTTVIVWFPPSIEVPDGDEAVR